MNDWRLIELLRVLASGRADRVVTFTRTREDAEREYEAALELLERPAPVTVLDWKRRGA
jgi:hypothetical protein